MRLSHLYNVQHVYDVYDVNNRKVGNVNANKPIYALNLARLVCQTNPFLKCWYVVDTGRLA